LIYAQLAVNGLVQGLVVGLGALALTLVFGIARFPNAATGDTMTFGAYTALTVHKASGSLVLGSIAAVGGAAVLALVAYLTVFKRLAGRSVVSLLVASIGIGFMIRAGLGIAFGHQQQVFNVPLSRPIRIAGLAINPLDLQLAVVAAVALAAVFAILYLTPIGRQMRAVADNRDLARVSGIRPERVMTAMWLIAGGVCAIGHAAADLCRDDPRRHRQPGGCGGRRACARRGAGGVDALRRLHLQDRPVLRRAARRAPGAATRSLRTH
jgi:neutral amino acid transport system permease protein